MISSKIEKNYRNQRRREERTNKSKHIKKETSLDWCPSLFSNGKDENDLLHTRSSDKRRRKHQRETEKASARYSRNKN